MAKALIVSLFFLSFNQWQNVRGGPLESLLPERCFDDLGCFNNGGWFALRQPNKLPQSPQEIGAKFLLNTRINRDGDDHVVIHYKDIEAVRSTYFDPRKDTKILVHGFLASGSQGEWVRMAETFLDNFDVNVIRVDWGSGNGFPYEQATANTRVVGAEIALLIQRLCRQYSITPAKFHIIGHSLGAHTSGYAGERLNGLGRITGLDPAEPYFQFLHESVRLDRSDADFVDVIHTDGQSIFNILVGGSGFGLMQPSGHVDFYPNGGKKQPGCENHDLCKDIINGNIKVITEKVACSHSRATKLFIESLNIMSTCTFKATICKDYRTFQRGRCGKCGEGAECADMGINADSLKGRKGIKLYFDTKSEAPYCKH